VGTGEENTAASRRSRETKTFYSEGSEAGKGKVKERKCGRRRIPDGMNAGKAVMKEGRKLKGRKFNRKPNRRYEVTQTDTATRKRPEGQTHTAANKHIN